MTSRLYTYRPNWHLIPMALRPSQLKHIFSQLGVVSFFLGMVMCVGVYLERGTHPRFVKYHIGLSFHQTLHLTRPLTACQHQQLYHSECQEWRACAANHFSVCNSLSAHNPFSCTGHGGQYSVSTWLTRLLVVFFVGPPLPRDPHHHPIPLCSSVPRSKVVISSSKRL